MHVNVGRDMCVHIWREICNYTRIGFDATVCEEHWLALAARHVRGVPACLEPGTGGVSDMFIGMEVEIEIVTPARWRVAWQVCFRDMVRKVERDIYRNMFCCCEAIGANRFVYVNVER